MECKDCEELAANLAWMVGFGGKDLTVHQKNTVWGLIDRHLPPERKRDEVEEKIEELSTYLPIMNGPDRKKICELELRELLEIAQKKLGKDEIGI